MRSSPPPGQSAVPARPVTTTARVPAYDPKHGAARHELRLYEDEREYGRTVAGFLVSGLAAGHPALAIATAPHRTAIERDLSALGVETARAIAAGRLLLLDARDTLASFMDARVPDERRFAQVIGAALDRCAAAAPDRPVFAHGEMVDLLCNDGNRDGALRLEALWNDLARHRHFHLLCTYGASTFGGADDIAAYQAVCAQHTHVRPTEEHTAFDDEVREREVARLQQRSRALESELERRGRTEQELRAALEAAERAEATVRARERELVELLENAAEAIHWVSADGRILWANRAERELLGYASDEYIGTSVADIHVDAPVIDGFLERLRRGETLRNEEARLRCKDGSIRHVLVNSNVLWRDGEFVHSCCFTTDVTASRMAAAERERLLEGERQAREEAQAANRAKTEFLGVMSHELRTPLNAITGYIQLLEMGLRGPVTREQRDDLGRIRQASQHLMGLVTDVLNFTRIEARRVEFDLQELEIGVVVTELEPLFLPQLDAKRLRYDAAGCAPPAPCSRHRVRTDPEKLRQILLNVLSNAIKFTEPGGLVSLECGCDAAGDLLRLTVRDTGRGIPPDQLERVFEPFVQIDRRGTQSSQQGIGLGLAISRELARGMGGDLVAASTPGHGCAFTVVLPRAVGER